MNTSRSLIVALGALALGGCAVSPEEDPVQIRMNDIDARLQRVERVVNNQSLIELAQRIDALQNDVRTIRGEVEMLQNQTEGGKTQSRNLYSDLEKRLAALETLGGVGAAPAPGVRTIRGEVEMLQNQTEGGKTQSRNLYSDLEKRLAALETLGGVGAAPAPGAIAAPVSGASEQATYDAGLAALRAGNYDKAISTFREVVTNYPAGDLASNAQFWMGESYYTKGDLESAVTAYRKVLTDWPASRKAPDAMVKLGFSLSDLKKTGEARTTLEEVVRKFPGTPAAQLAADRLKRLGR